MNYKKLMIVAGLTFAMYQIDAMFSSAGRKTVPAAGTAVVGVGLTTFGIGRGEDDRIVPGESQKGPDMRVTAPQLRAASEEFPQSDLYKSTAKLISTINFQPTIDFSLKEEPVMFSSAARKAAPAVAGVAKVDLTTFSIGRRENDRITSDEQQKGKEKSKKPREAPGEGCNRFYKNPNNRRVSMCDQQTIKYNNEGQLNQTISTFGLGGCIAVIYARKTALGDIIVTMNHYPPVSKDQQKNSLKRLILQDMKLGVPIVEKSLIVSTPGEWVKNSDNRWAMQAQDSFYVDQLSQIVDVPAQEAVYSEEATSQDYFYPCLIVKFDHTGQLIWSGKGDHHVRHQLFSQIKKSNLDMEELD